MRDIASRFEDENKHQATELEELRIEIVELKKQLELYEDKLSQANIMREDKLNQQLSAIKDLERELDQRGKRIRELQREKETVELKASEESS